MKISTSDEKAKDMFYSILYAINENESTLISERTKLGLKTARARGRNGGRPSISNEIKKQIKDLYREKTLQLLKLLKSRCQYYNSL